MAIDERALVAREIKRAVSYVAGQAGATPLRRTGLPRDIAYGALYLASVRARSSIATIW